MFREIAQIVLAIQLSAGPHYPSVRARQLATTIQHQSDAIGIDPMVEVAIIAHESQWRERIISPDNEDYGLMQVRARHYGGLDQWLLQGEHNIAVGSYIIKLDIDLCRKHLGREPETQEWMSCYQGSCTTKSHWCKPTKLTKTVEDYSQCLIDATSSDAETKSTAACGDIYWISK